MRYLAPVALLVLLTSCSSECTLVGCSSTLELTVTHTLDLASGPYRLDVITPQQELRCSIGPELEGTGTCFGFRFTDLRWDATSATLTLTGPFGDALENPDGDPFEEVEVILSDGPSELSRATAPVDPGPPSMPNGPGCAPTCWGATASASL